MKFNQAMLEIRKLANKSEEHGQAAERASQTYTAHMTLFNVAASAGDEKGMEMHRQTIHNTVDTILDSGAMVAKLKAEILRISQSVTDFPQSF
jgi:hypothetical protein